jgi:hypothetical protein
MQLRNPEAYKVGKLVRWTHPDRYAQAENKENRCGVRHYTEQAK